jgi:hypothetical protein
MKSIQHHTPFTTRQIVPNGADDLAVEQFRQAAVEHWHREASADGLTPWGDPGAVLEPQTNDPRHWVVTGDVVKVTSTP